MQQFLDAFFLPLLAHRAALPDKACRLQTCSGLVAVLVSSGHWQQLRQLAGACCLALETASAGAAAQAAPPGGRDVEGSCSQSLHVACTLLTTVVQHLRPLAAGTEQSAGVRINGYAHGGGGVDDLRVRWD